MQNVVFQSKISRGAHHVHQLQSCVTHHLKANFNEISNYKNSINALLSVNFLAGQTRFCV